jgi:hypothetical protein
MSFLAPFMLFGALAAAIPVAIHLFFRSRYRTVPWAAMKFLLTSVEQTSRRLKFQELFLLLLRMLVLAMLALAFARPISTLVRGAGRGDAVDAVMVFDTSFSMGANDGAKTRIERAKLEALKIIDELPPHSSVQIITCAGNANTLVGPRSSANLDQARDLVQHLELTHLATDLALGVAKARDVLGYAQSANKELYVFSDMQQTGFEQQSDKLKATLLELKEKAIVHFVRCGTRTLKNVAIVSITPQTGMPRPGERVGFAVLVRNTGSEPVHNLKVSLMVDGDEKKIETQAIPELKGKETQAVTLSGKLEKAGLRVLTAKAEHDDLDGDNRYDQVILVRDQVNILVVDGNPNDKEPTLASSFYLMHALLPVKDADRATYHYNPRMVPARLASPLLLKDQDICILVNCSVQAKAGAQTLPTDFIEALEPFVRSEGRGLLIFSGGNVQAEPYNKLLGRKLGLLPMPLKPALKADKEPFKVDRQSFRFAPPAFWIFKDDPRYYKDFDKVEVWQYLQLDEAAAPIQDESTKQQPDKKLPNPADQNQKDSRDGKEVNPPNVVMRINNGQPIVVFRKIDAGEVVFVATAAHEEGLDAQTSNPNWTYFGIAPEFIPFVHVTLNYLMHSQTQTYNLVAGQTLHWYPKDKGDNAYYLVHPDGKRVDRLGLPEKHDKRLVVTATDLPRAGIYRMAAQSRASEWSEAMDPIDAVKKGTPIAVIPDLNESADLTSLTSAQIDDYLAFTPIHVTAGENASASTSADRLNREWTVWALLAVMVLVLFEVALAWWCGRAW